MKPRHVAAISLAGWLLILPPTNKEFPRGNADAPLNQWAKRPTTYRTKEECEHVLDRQQRLTNARNRQVTLQFYKKAQCVPSDDPRLKRN
ncbi:MAG: hypothetical protein ACLQAT_30365 [Candidatus Binataceae bacterium]